MIHLSQWLNTAPQTLVALDGETPIYTDDLHKRVSYWLDVLPIKSDQRWAVYHRDAVEFMALLLAFWQRGCTVCVPNNNQVATVAQLRPMVDGFVGDFGEDSCHLKPKSVNGIQEQVTWPALYTDFIALEIYTSGTTGTPKFITKTIAQLDAELEYLNTFWSNDTTPLVVATVSHLHFYGMVFRLFLPLCSGRTFEANECEYTEGLFNRVSKVEHFVLVSSPSHLSRINSALDWHLLAPKCEGVFSSAAPLSQSDSLNVASLFNTQVTEILGSSETGAIAWRQQTTGGNDFWTAMPSVTVAGSKTGHLLVTSAAVEGGEWLLADRVEMSQNERFKLLGRTDRVVKVEGKRVCLERVEQLLLKSPLVNACKALTTSRRRTELALVVELTKTAQEQLRLDGKKSLVATLKSELCVHLDRVTLPKRWRFVSQLPYNAQGKLPLQRLQAMFNDTVKLPQVTRIQETDEGCYVHARVTSDLVYFEGHFEGNPVLPGVVQVHWAEYYGRQKFTMEGQFKGLEVLKFHQVILPDTDIELLLDYAQDKQKLTFKYSSRHGIHSSGRICFG